MNNRFCIISLILLSNITSISSLISLINAATCRSRRVLFASPDSFDTPRSRRDAMLLPALSSLTLLVPRSSALAESASKKAAKIPSWSLPRNVFMPQLALNTVGLTEEDTFNSVGYALLNGITHIDFHPGRERDGVARYIRENTRLRSSLFLNTKIRKAPPGTSPSLAAALASKQIDDDLEVLGVSSVDMLMLRDSPDADVIQAQWRVVEEALKKGKTRSVGVINFCQSAIDAVMTNASVPPALNYYMLHVGMGSRAKDLRKYCDDRGIRTFAYGAVGEPGPSSALLSSPALNSVASSYGKTPSQVALRWVTQSGAAVSVRPTLNFGLGRSACSSQTEECLAEVALRAENYSWKLSKDDMSTLDNISDFDDNPTLFSSKGCPDSFVMPKKKR